jgi:hypothetical protein
MLNGFPDDGMYQIRLGKPHLSFMRVHIDIDILGRQCQEDKGHGKALLGENVAIRFSQGMENDSIAYYSAIDKEVQGVARRPTPCWWRYKA